MIRWSCLVLQIFEVDSLLSKITLGKFCSCWFAYMYYLWFHREEFCVVISVGGRWRTSVYFLKQMNKTLLCWLHEWFFTHRESKVNNNSTAGVLNILLICFKQWQKMPQPWSHRYEIFSSQSIIWKNCTRNN